MVRKRRCENCRNAKWLTVGFYACTLTGDRMHLLDGQDCTAFRPRDIDDDRSIGFEMTQGGQA